MNKIWQTAPAAEALQQSLAAGVGVSEVTAQVMINRGIRDAAAAAAYLEGTLADCPEARQLSGMAAAVARIRAALSGRETIAVYGDYDVDGLTATTLLTLVLRQMGATVIAYIPHRVEEGYGLNCQACAELHRRGARLLITVDCGISAGEPALICHSLGLDLIITDHHQPHGRIAAPAVAVINPLQPGCAYPYKSLAGVGLAYKLAVALCGSQAVAPHLDLVALGTISDVAPLTGENRILVRHGLQILSRTAKPGLAALIDVAGIAGRTLTAHHVGFMLGPRLNATGRIGSAGIALELLLCADAAAARELANRLDQENRQRQRLEAQTVRHAVALAEQEIDFSRQRAVVLHHDDWHPGVIGIVASRLAERFNRPTILISTAGAAGKGSGRSIRNFHLFDAIVRCGHLLQTFGGHEKAAGLSICRENLPAFKQQFAAICDEKLQPDDLIPVLDADSEISLSQLTPMVLRELEQCAPFGIGNPQPRFFTRGLRLKAAGTTGRGNGRTLWVTDGRHTCAAVISRYGEQFAALPPLFSLLYSPALNDWQGIESINLQVKDMQAAVSSAAMMLQK